MDVKPTRGMKVEVQANREAVFGEEGVSVDRVTIKDNERRGTMTGMTLAGFAEIEMPKLDGKKHWYPVEEIKGEHGEHIVEDEIQVEEDGREDAE